MIDYADKQHLEQQRPAFTFARLWLRIKIAFWENDEANHRRLIDRHDAEIAGLRHSRAEAMAYANHATDQVIALRKQL